MPTEYTTTCPVCYIEINATSKEKLLLVMTLHIKFEHPDYYKEQG